MKRAIRGRIRWRSILGEVLHGDHVVVDADRKNREDDVLVVKVGAGGAGKEVMRCGRSVELRSTWTAEGGCPYANLGGRMRPPLPGSWRCLEPVRYFSPR
jgi:hypothetical protein